MTMEQLPGASMLVGLATLWAVMSGTHEDRLYLVARMRDGRWVCSGSTMPVDHPAPSVECRHIRRCRRHWEEQIATLAAENNGSR